MLVCQPFSRRQVNPQPDGRVGGRVVQQCLDTHRVASSAIVLEAAGGALDAAGPAETAGPPAGSNSARPKAVASSGANTRSRSSACRVWDFTVLTEQPNARAASRSVRS